LVEEFEPEESPVVRMPRSLEKRLEIENGTSALIDTDPGVANQPSNCSVHARKSKPGGVTIARSARNPKGRDERSGAAIVVILSSVS